MRVRVAGLLVVAGVASFVAQGAGAASYQKIDGTIVDPILDRLGNVHTYAGPNLGPGVSAVNASLQNANLSAANLASSSFYNAFLYQADLTGADLRGADLFGTNLSSAILTGADLTNAYYGFRTTFPAGFDPVAAGMITGPRVINNGLAPPNPDNVIDRPEEEFIVNNAGCNALIAYPCIAPGDPTTVWGDLYEVRLYETSSFVGSITGSLTAWDQSHAELTSVNWSGGVSARGQSEVVANKPFNSTDSSSAWALDESTLMLTGGSWNPVHAKDRSEVTYAGWGYDGSDVYVTDDAFLDYQGNSWGLWIEDRGRAVVRSEVQFWIAVGPDATLELVGGGSGDLRLFDVDGTLKMTGGSASPYGVRVSGYADIQGGGISAEPESYTDVYGEVPGPWNLVAEGTGLIELSGGHIHDQDGAGTNAVAPRFAARDGSKIRLFGSSFEVDGAPVTLGSIGSSTGTVAATLANGDPLNNPFAHRGADCGGQPCTGRILVLAPGLDWDQDAVPNPFDNCAEEPNADQADVDTDGTGDVCFAPVDLDRDGIVDALDNCRVDANADQADADSDGVGDACEKDLIFWADKGLEGCTTPPKRLPYELVTNDLGNGDVIDRSAQPCDCFGIEYPVTPGTASVRFVHRTASGFVEEYCENVAPYALGLGPNQPICADGLDEDGLHELMVTPYDAPGCEAGGGNALASSIRRFEMATPEPGVAVMVGVGALGLAGVSRRKVSERRERPDSAAGSSRRSKPEPNGGARPHPTR